jgi:cell division protein FtsN
MEKYRGLGLFPYRVKVDLGKDGIWHRIFFGHYKTMREAQEAAGRLQVNEAVAKHTRFAALVGSYPDRQQAATEMQRLQALEYSPYIIAQENGGFELFVGAFYTQQGAQAQQSELLARGVKSQVVER